MRIATLAGLAAIAAVSATIAHARADGVAPATPSKVIAATVSRAIDGDTIVAYDNDVKITVRVLGIDTPEIKHGAQAVQCYGPEAARFAQRYTVGQRVRLRTEPSSGDVTDRYGRTLAYVYLVSRHRDLGAVELERGYARVYAFHGRRFAKRTHYETLEKNARAAHRGRWGSCTR